MGWKYRGGLLLIMVVVIMWVTSAEITQGIFTNYKHPFAVTYLGTSLLVVYLPIAFIKDWLLKFLKHSSCNESNSTENLELGSRVKHEIEHRDPLTNYKDSAIELCLKEEGNPLVCSHEEAAEALKQNRKLTAKETAAFGFCIAPLWFLTEYLTNAALARTDVASTTLLSSTSGLFTLLFGALLGEETVDLVKVISVVLSIAGVAMTTLGNTWAADEAQSITSNNGKHSLLADLFAILSAMIYGLFTVLLKKFSGEEGERVDMQKLFGYIGLFTFAALWWLVCPLNAIGLEPKFTLPRTAKMKEIIVFNSFVGNVLCDYFWALGVVWTSPLTAALGVSLTIPIAMLEDVMIHGQQYSAIYIIGSAQVFLGFVIADVSNWTSEKLRWWTWMRMAK